MPVVVPRLSPIIVSIVPDRHDLGLEVPLLPRDLI